MFASQAANKKKRTSDITTSPVTVIDYSNSANDVFSFSSTDSKYQSAAFTQPRVAVTPTRPIKSENPIDVTEYIGDKEVDAIQNSAVVVKFSKKAQFEDGEVADLARQLHKMGITLHQAGPIYRFGFTPDFFASVAPVDGFSNKITMMKAAIDGLFRFIGPRFVPEAGRGSTAVKERMAVLKADKNLIKEFGLDLYYADHSIIQASEGKVCTSDTICVRLEPFIHLFALRAGMKWDDLFKSADYQMGRYLYRVKNGETGNIEYFVSVSCFPFAATAVYDRTKICGAVTSPKGPVMAGVAASEIVFKAFSALTHMVNSTVYRCRQYDCNEHYRMGQQAVPSVMPPLESDKNKDNKHSDPQNLSAAAENPVLKRLIAQLQQDGSVNAATVQTQALKLKEAHTLNAKLEEDIKKLKQDMFSIAAKSVMVRTALQTQPNPGCEKALNFLLEGNVSMQPLLKLAIEGAQKKPLPQPTTPPVTTAAAFPSPYPTVGTAPMIAYSKK